MKGIRKVLIGLAMALGFSMSAHAATVEFTGSFIITAVSAGCAGEWFVGDEGLARFTPRNLGDNGSNTRFSVFFRTFAFNHTLGSNLTSTFKVVNGTQIGRGASTFTSEMRVTSQSPSTITATTNFVTLVGQVKDLTDVTGCTVTFRSGLARRP
jgi:hypothetical protein